MPTSDPTAVFVLAAWFFALGGVVGSFLNVVVWRLPAGMSLSTPPSHCPKCKTPIRWYDNVPILAWLWLGGRCRACKAPISARYPLVEAMTALIFLAVSLSVLLSVGGAANDARSAGGAAASLEKTPATSSATSVSSPASAVVERSAAAASAAPRARLVHLDLVERALVAGYLLFALSTLLAAGWIELDGKRVPRRLFFPAILVGIAAPLVIGDFLRPFDNGWLAAPAFADGALGAAAGALIAAAWRPLRRDALPLLAFAMLGLYLGWQLALIVTIAASIAAFALWPWRRRSLAAVLAVTVVAALLALPLLTRIALMGGIRTRYAYAIPKSTAARFVGRHGAQPLVGAPPPRSPSIDRAVDRGNAVCDGARPDADAKQLPPQRSSILKLGREWTKS